MKILDGKKLSEKILAELREELKKTVLKLRLAVIQVGENPVSKVYIERKGKAAEKIGIGFKLYQVDEKTNPEELKEEIEKIVSEIKNSGVIVQLPLPKKFSPEEFLNLIPAEKDIDVLSEKSLGKFYQGTLKIMPPVVAGILGLLRNYKIELKGKNIALVGAGRLVGLPLTLQLLREKATVSVLNEFTEDTAYFTKKADILISGVGKPNLIKGNMVKKGVVVIDAGTTKLKGKLLGDVDFKSVAKKASYIAPVPGGVGPMTVACLLGNLVKLNIP
ncbi:MAG: bifunctional methylenetetrahydrofolate dehydrogenase/methenyltetrahydrofolate cyclohydrolase [Candidatus Nealsonbacteria bacterium CG08_land_8_20_14_0_20_38_20]|uniref:Bifunctional protein FolD n=1 Tax=Candidatus Nealsonbacteria bacterium CG08_land_8_20_14_0_20_38_20 TaxID=1974705 RepID=A0A2H0YPI7_9BACT|nr:MAG: bifunctional methylenetetrahydrofolate dehydrogenase/methenyltetrahydrofolate cyclohydrolase [Candidatus Nealsonbacteria bacterium CG08_land_8_20_14_0_20_38_20]